MATEASSLTARGPRIVLALVCLGLLVAGARYRGHSVESMDVRTYAQMIRGVSEHGLPYWDNGPIDRFPELVVQWGIPAHGHIWGIYGALYPYLAAPIFRLGGLERVSGFTFAFLAPLALATFLLARRIVRSEWTATIAAILAVGSTPIAAKSLEMTPFGLICVFATFGLWLTVLLIQTPSAQRRIVTALACGLMWAAAAAAHAVCFPMALAALAVLAVAPEPNEVFAIPRDRAARAATFRTMRARLAPSFLGFVIGLVPVAFLNHLRFGSYNPLSYGPIPWTGLVNQELHKMTLGHQLRYSALPAAVVGVTLAALYLARRHRALQAVIVVATVAAFALEPHLRERVIRYALVAWADIVDMSFVDMPAYRRQPDGIGRIFGGWVTKSTLQCTPVLILAPLALRRAGARLWPLLAVLIPCAALYLSLITRANLAYTDAVGWPWVYIRYVFAALPGLLVASVAVIERLGPRRLDLALAVLIGLALAYAYLGTTNDVLLIKRVSLLIVPIAAAALALIAALFASRRWRTSEGGAPGSAPLACALASVTVGLGIASALGHDLRANLDGKRGCDGIVDRLDRAVPSRFAFVGSLGQFDVMLTSAATHDVQYADTMRLNDYKELRPLLDYWWADKRPIYMLWPSPPWSPWPDVGFKPVPVPGLFLVELGRSPP